MKRPKYVIPLMFRMLITTLNLLDVLRHITKTGKQASERSVNLFLLGQQEVC